MRVSTFVKIGYAAFAAVVLMQGSRWSTTEREALDFGKYRLTTYNTVRPFSIGSGTKMTLCRRESDFCLEDRSLSVWPAAPSERSARFILVSGDKPTLVHVFDTATGLELPCRNCDTPLWRLYRDSDLIVWSPSVLNAAGVGAGPYRAALGSLADGISPFVIVLDLEPGAIAATRIAVPRDALAVHPSELTFSANSDVVAWYACAPAPTQWQRTGHCDLWWYRISDQQSYHRATPCPHTDYLEVGWEGDTPRAQIASGATAERDLCLDAKGKPALPIGGRSSGAR